MDLQSAVTIVGSILVPLGGVYIAYKGIKQKEMADKVKLESTKQQAISAAHDDTRMAAKELRDEIWQELREVKELNSRLRKENAELRSKVTELTSEIKIFKTEMLFKISLLESAHNDLPIPQWLKDERGVILSINPAYVNIFLKPMGKAESDYKGHTDYEVWPQDVADEFRANDDYVLKSGQPWVGYEVVPDGKGNMVKWQILKYVRRSGNMIIGIAGVAFPSSYEQMMGYISGVNRDSN